MSDFRLEKLFKFNWQFGLALILVFGIPRFLIVLQANATGIADVTAQQFDIGKQILLVWDQTNRRWQNQIESSGETNSSGLRTKGF